jgi:hypothetical protein
MRINMPSRRSEVFVTEFLRDALGVGALGVPKLEARARAEGLLGERQRISTAKPFRKAKSALGIQSIRDGFGPGGAWLWKLPRDREAPAASSIKRQPVRTERRVPLDWIPIGGRRSWRIFPHMRFRAPGRA